MRLAIIDATKATARGSYGDLTAIFFGPAGSGSWADYVATTSYGRAELTGRVFGWYPWESEEPPDQAQTLALAGPDGFRREDFDFVVVLQPQGSGVNDTGSVWKGQLLLDNTGHANFYVISRVFGHANVVFDDPFDPGVSVGGNNHNRAHYPANVKRQLGWLTAADEARRWTAGTFLIGRLEGNLDQAPRLVNIDAGPPMVVFGAERFQSRFQIGYRVVGVDAFDDEAYLGGLEIRLAGSLVVARPGATSRRDATLREGQTFVDAATGITLTLSSAGAQSALVTVAYAAVVPDAPPTLPPAGPGDCVKVGSNIELRSEAGDRYVITATGKVFKNGESTGVNASALKKVGAFVYALSGSRWAKAPDWQDIGAEPMCDPEPPTNPPASVPTNAELWAQLMQGSQTVTISGKTADGAAILFANGCVAQVKL